MPRRRQRVLAAAAKLKYSPNQSGRSLRRGATHAVAFMLNPHPGDQQYGEPFFIPFLIGLQAKLAEHGLDLIVVMGAPGDYQQERLRRVVEAKLADAVVLASTRRKDERIDYLTDVGFPVRDAGKEQTPAATATLRSISTSKRRGVTPSSALSRRATGGSPRSTLPPISTSAISSCAAIERVCGGMRSSRTRAWSAAARSTKPAAMRRRPEIMQGDDPPTAIIFNNDAMALGGCKALAEMGLRPGRDFAVIVITDTPLCRYFSPALTSFRPPLEPLGQRLAEMLLASMPAHAGPEGVRVLREVWPMELIPRESDPRLLPKISKSRSPRRANGVSR